MRNTILFDLDGTLLPVEIEDFTRVYFSEMGKYFSDLIEPEKLIDYVWTGTKAMIASLDKRTNEKVFMESFKKSIGDDISTYVGRFDSFYDKGFLLARKTVKRKPIVKDTIEILKDKGYSLVIATNPLFPEKAILHRIAWAGLDARDFDYISNYEQNSYCKPNIEFYEEVLQALGKGPEQCYMVGNHVQEDMVASRLGIKTYLVTDYMINDGEEIQGDYKGDYEDFYRFCSDLPNI
ncbi:MAG TPA: HAD family hydrolase [Bacillota bacterium]|nr:HAD family hydrolase [Bacillota bacterium]